LTGLKLKWWRVKTVNGTLFRVIEELDAISETMETLGKHMGVSVPQVVVHEYYRLLLAAEKLRIFERNCRADKSVTPITYMKEKKIIKENNRCIFK
jgi:hypothetical protein